MGDESLRRALHPFTTLTLSKLEFKIIIISKVGPFKGHHTSDLASDTTYKRYGIGASLLGAMLDCRWKQDIILCFHLQRIHVSFLITSLYLPQEVQACRPFSLPSVEKHCQS